MCGSHSETRSDWAYAGGGEADIGHDLKFFLRPKVFHVHDGSN